MITPKCCERLMMRIRKKDGFYFKCKRCHSQKRDPRNKEKK